MRRCYAAFVLILLGCPKVPGTVVLAESSVDASDDRRSVAAVAPAGSVRDGSYVDGSYPLAIALPDGWQAQAGASDAQTHRG